MGRTLAQNVLARTADGQDLYLRAGTVPSEEEAALVRNPFAWEPDDEGSDPAEVERLEAAAKAEAERVAAEQAAAEEAARLEAEQAAAAEAEAAAKAEAAATKDAGGKTKPPKQ
jgi:hypothetical protein